jgi:hypothetical protein
MIVKLIPRYPWKAEGLYFMKIKSNLVNVQTNFQPTNPNSVTPCKLWINTDVLQ